MPETFARMCEKMSGEKPEVNVIAYSGRTLEWHRKSYFSLRFALMYGKYDHCILQQYAHPFPDEASTEEICAELIGMCRKYGTEPLIFMTWAKRDEPEASEQMSRLYRKIGADNNVRVVPIGEMFDEINKHHPEIDLYWEDGAHASVYADYMIAAAFAACLVGTEKLDRIGDEAIDFKVVFEAQDGRPKAEEDTEKTGINIDREKTKTIRKIIINKYL